MSTDWAEIEIVAKGPTPKTADMTVSLAFHVGNIDVFKEAVKRLKDMIHQDERTWDETEKCWYTKPCHLEMLKAFSREFTIAMLIDGERWENLRTGRVMIQGRLTFDEADE